MEFIVGSKEIINDYGYWPTFHDDYITKIEIHGSSIDMIIRMENVPEGFDEYYLLITFEDVSKFSLEGELLGTTCIILDLEFKKSELITCNIYSSMGVGGFVQSKEIIFKKLIVNIDLTDIIDIKSLHEILAKYLSFPKFYGMNWDAFWDSITGLVNMPRTIIFKGWEVFEKNNPKNALILKDLLNEYRDEYDSDFKAIYR